MSADTHEELRWSSTTPRGSSPAGAGSMTTVPWWRSLRTRTAAAIAMLSLALVLVSAAVFAHFSLDGARDQLRDQAVAQLQLALATQAFGGVLPGSATTGARGVPRELVTALSGSTISTFDDGTFMWAARRSDEGGTVSTKLSNEPLDRQWHELSLSFFCTALAALVVSTSLGWVVAGRLTSRLRAAARSVNDLVDGHGPALPEGRDEVAVMSRVIIDTARELSNRLDHEKAFAADVAHDLRTPLTALVSATQLLEDGPDTRRVVRQVTRIRGLVEDLLELARAENDHRSVDVETVSLGETVASIIDASVYESVCLVIVASDREVRIDVRRLSRALENIVANAATHGRPPVVVTVEDDLVTVQDHGDGFPQRLLQQGPRRFSSAGNRAGSGLGLAIAVRHLEVMDASLTLTSPALSGAKAVIRLPVETEEAESDTAGE